MPRIHAPVLLPATGRRGFGGAVFLALFVVLASMACFKYLALHSTVSQLGLALSDLYTIHVDGAWWRAFRDQARPLLPLYAQVYRLVPDQAAPLVLLTLQALALALPALATGRRYGVLAALAYALYFPVWTNALNGFHLDHLLVPALFGFLLACREERFGLATVLGLLPALIGEFHTLTTAACGLYLYAAHGRRRAGLGLVLAGGLMLYLARVWVVPFCTVEASRPGLWAGLWSGLMAGWQAEATGSWLEGGWHLFLCFGALLFFPAVRPAWLLPALPTMLLVLFASSGPTAWSGPVTAGLAGVLFFAFCEVLGPVRMLFGQSGSSARRFGLVVLSVLGLVHVLLSPSPLSWRFLAGDSFEAGLNAYEPTARDATILAEILRTIPDDDSVTVVSQNTLNWGALAERRHFGSFPDGVFAPHPFRDCRGVTWRDIVAYVRSGRRLVPPTRTWQADYVILDTTRPWAIRGHTGVMRNGACQNAELARSYQTLLIRARQAMDTVEDRDGLIILRRRAPTTPSVATPPGDQTPAAPPANHDQPGTPGQ